MWPDSAKTHELLEGVRTGDDVAVNRLLDAGWIRECDDRPAPELDDERRRYFAITKVGLQVLRQELWRLERMIGTVREKSIRPLPPKNV